MKFYVLNNNAVHPTVHGVQVILYSATNMVVQAGEIKKIRTSITLEPPPGKCVFIVSDTELVGNSAVEVFGAPLVISSYSEEELLIPLKNSGRNPLNILKGHKVACAILVDVYEIKLQDGGKREVLEPNPEKSLPPKIRGSDIKFEIK